MRRRGASRWFEWVASYVRAAGGDPSTSLCRIDEKSRALFREGSRYWQAKSIKGLLPIADWYIFRDWADSLTDRYLIVHAAALERRGEALLLVGRTGSGKSTLALSLTRRGFGYLGDEFALVCLKTQEAVPLPKALCIKDQNAVKVSPPDPHFAIIAFPPGCTPRYRTALCCIPHREIVPPPGKRFPVRWVVLVSEKTGSGSLVPVSRSRGVIELYKACRRTDESVLRSVAALARKVEFWDLGRNGVDQMTEAVEKVTRRAAP